MDTTHDMVERYIALWNEPDSEARRALIRDLWAPDGSQVLQPPGELLEEAARIGFVNPVLEARGHRELEARVTRSYQEFVAPGEFRFRGCGDATQLGPVVTFGWEMVSVARGDVAGGGVEFVILDACGQIRTDYQFIGR